MERTHTQVRYRQREVRRRNLLKRQRSTYPTDSPRFWAELDVVQKHAKGNRTIRQEEAVQLYEIRTRCIDLYGCAAEAILLTQGPYCSVGGVLGWWTCPVFLQRFISPGWVIYLLVVKVSYLHKYKFYI